MGPPQVTVVGAGILGASIALHLAERDCQVTVVEAAPRPAEGATGKSWAWLNANRKRPAHYRDLNKQSMHEWQQRFADVAQFPGLLWLEDDQPSRPEYPSQQINGAELKQLEANLEPSLFECQANFYEQEGICDPVEATQHFLDQAVKHNADLLFSERVVNLLKDGDRVTGVVTDRRELRSDTVVIAAGTGVPEIAAKLDAQVPLLDKPAVIVRTKRLPRLIHRMVIARNIFLWQGKDGRVLIGDIKPPNEGATRDTSQNNATRILQAAAEVLPELRQVEIDACEVGFRPYPKDGYPIVGSIPGWRGAYVAVTHSGATLAPLLGRLVATEVVDGRECEELTHYRPNRDFKLGDNK